MPTRPSTHPSARPAAVLAVGAAVSALAACGEPATPALAELTTTADTVYETVVRATDEGAEVRGTFPAPCPSYRLAGAVEVLGSTATLRVVGRAPEGGCPEGAEEAGVGYRARIHGLGDDVWDLEVRHAWPDADRPERRVVGRPVAALGADRAWTARDSAGVEIVESARPLWERGEAWEVAPEPVLEIGVVDGAPAYQLGQVAGAARLPDGTVVVGDAGSQDVRFYARDGRHLRTVGGTGGGPGEFTGLATLGPGPDGGVWAYDFPLRRVTWLGPDGSLEGVDVLGPEPAVLNAVGPLPDRTLVLKELWAARRVAEARTEGLRRDSIAYVAHRPGSEGAGVDTIARVPGREVVLAGEDGRMTMAMPPFARSSVAAIREGRLVTGSQAAWELEEWTPEGERVRVIRLPAEDRTVTNRDVAAFIDAYVEGVPEERRPGLRASLERLPPAPSRPAYGELLADRDGNLWVGEYVVFPAVPRSWTVLDPAGRWLGTVDLPEGFRPLDIGADWVLGVTTDALDVERVVVHRLTRPGAGR